MKIKDFMKVIMTDEYGVLIIESKVGKRTFTERTVYEGSYVAGIPEELKEKEIRWIDFSIYKERYLICIENEKN